MAEPRPKLLWVKSGPLHPLDSGGKIRTFKMLERLKDLFEIHYIALHDPNIAPSQECEQYSDTQKWIAFEDYPRKSARFVGAAFRNAFASRLPLVLEKYRSHEMRAAILDAVAKKSPDLIICDFLTPALNFPPDLAAKSVLFQHNVEAEIWRRLAETETRPFLGKYFRSQWQRMEKAEKELSEKFRKVVAVSEADAGTFRERYGLRNVAGAVPTGVDVEYFGAVERTPKAGQVIFLGSMDWLPNIDATEFFLADILPLIRAGGTPMRLKVIGRNPPASLIERGKSVEGVEFTGTVPDVRPHLSDAAIAVVPLRAGGGTRIKIFELMAAGVPVISTTVGAEGLPVMHGEHILLADTAKDFADATARLLRDPAEASRISNSARELVASRYGWGEIAAEFARLCS